MDAVHGCAPQPSSARLGVDYASQRLSSCQEALAVDYASQLLSSCQEDLAVDYASQNLSSCFDSGHKVDAEVQ